MQINEARSVTSGTKAFSLFNLGFRVFFLASGLFALITMTMWLAIIQFQFSVPTGLISNSQWHAHELIYGYSIAVIAGFLLTAVKNWTGVSTVTHKPLAFIFSMWLVARVLFLFGTKYLAIAAVFDQLFLLTLLIAVAYPIFKVRQWGQSAILVILILLLVFNGLYFLGGLGNLASGIDWGLYGGLYLILGLVLFMARRVIPFFIERGVGYEVKLFNSKWLDNSIIVLWCGFFIAEVFAGQSIIGAWLALGMSVTTGARLAGWHTSGIWRKSMLWSVYLGCWFISIGFLLLACAYFFGISKFLAIHAFAVGGIGLITMGMMSRVALGHTGRDVSRPALAISYSLGMLVVAGCVRVALPLVDPSHYMLWLGISQILWIAAFVIFVVIYSPILSRPRVDNQPG